MTATTTTETTDEPNRADIMDSLVSQAESYRPRMFAIYGIYRGLGESLPEQPFLGWGIEVYPDNGYPGAVFFDPRDRDTRRAESADAVLRSFRRHGEARLVWLD